MATRRSIGYEPSFCSKTGSFRTIVCDHQPDRLFSTQGPLMGGFKVGPCFLFQTFQGDPAYVSLTILENRQDLGRTDCPVRVIQYSRCAVLLVDPLLADVLHAVKPQTRGYASNKCLSTYLNLRAHRHSQKLQCSLGNWYTRIYH
jgi:hypothetical protein